MFLGRLGSLNSLEKTRGASSWRKYLGSRCRLPSADTLGRVASRIDPDAIRRIQADLYRVLRRNKALGPAGDLFALVIDGHESMSSHLRRCAGCLCREVGGSETRRRQYYHRYVVCSLVGRDFHLFLDLEPIGPGEGEVTAARRLYARVHRLYARAYDVVMGDGLYLEGPFIREVIERGKDVLVVLKREDLHLFRDAEALFAGMEPRRYHRGGRRYRCWDLSGFTSLDTVKHPLRVVKAEETWDRKRQATGAMERLRSRWMWATTLDADHVGTERLVEIGHWRWAIENQGFNEGVNHYSMDHVYRHEPTAMLVLLLLAMVAINLFQTFYRRNCNAAFRGRFSRMDVARMVLVQLYAGVAAPMVPG